MSINERKLMKMLSSLPNDVYPNDDNIKAVEIIKNNFQNISEKGREEIFVMLIALCKLQFNRRTFIRDVLEIMIVNYDALPKDTQDWFLDYLKIYFWPESYIGDGEGDIFSLDSIISEVINKNYSNMSPELRSRFVRISSDT